MAKYTILTITVYICVVCLVPNGATEQSKLNWYILHPPITYWSDIQLVCNTTCCIKGSNESASWVVGEGGDLKTLSKNLISTNDSKYTILTSKNECRLEIKNFGPDDADQLYSCYYNFYRYSKMLTLDALSFENQPGKDDIIVKERIVDDRYMIVADIRKAFPPPVCKAFMGDRNLSKSMDISTRQRGLLVDVKIKLNTTIGLDDTFRLKCRIGTRIHVIKEIAFIQNVQTTAECTCKWFWPFMAMSIIVAIVITVAIVLICRNYKKPGIAELEIVDIKQLQENPESKPLLPDVQNFKDRVQALKSMGRTRYNST